MGYEVPFFPIGIDSDDGCCDQKYIVGPRGFPGPTGPEGPAGVSRIIKAGILTAEDFSGIPQTATVIFLTPFSDSTYVLSLAGEDSRLFTYGSKTENGFTISANSNDELTGEVSWMATVTGETS